jgi:hypothetical protein
MSNNSFCSYNGQFKHPYCEWLYSNTCLKVQIKHAYSSDQLLLQFAIRSMQNCKPWAPSDSLASCMHAAAPWNTVTCTSGQWTKKAAWNQLAALENAHYYCNFLVNYFLSVCNFCGHQTKRKGNDWAIGEPSTEDYWFGSHFATRLPCLLKKNKYFCCPNWFECKIYARPVLLLCLLTTESIWERQ